MESLVYNNENDGKIWGLKSRFNFRILHGGYPSYPYISNEVPETMTMSGSRSVYMYGTSRLSRLTKIYDILYFTPRRCICGLHSIESPLGTAYCVCYGDFSQQDQPAIQGSLLGIILLGNLTMNYFPGFTASKVKLGDSSNPLSKWITLIGFPTPSCLRSILQEMNLLHVVEFLPESSELSSLEYIELISKGKLPIANTKPSVDYHMYIHDVCNHLFFWLFQPEWMRHKVICYFSFFLSEIKILLNLCPQYQSLIYCHLYDIIGSFDAAQGSVNNYVISSLRSEQSITTSLEALTIESDIVEHIQQLLNMGGNINLLTDQKSGVIYVHPVKETLFVAILSSIPRISSMMFSYTYDDSSTSLKHIDFFQHLQEVRHQVHTLEGLQKLNQEMVSAYLASKHHTHGTPSTAMVQTDFVEYYSVSKLIDDFKLNYKTAVNVYDNSIS
ncbi:MAG: hypothetical protein Sylvanvirus24_4 [Sylvanvirus sp.]|uniref:Uncharacterized protein n=1 Tax=Sylvanvirus sp. TaxID=2487774 RepID=A0A3G5AM47_9VIRU|nr:MAG: hypothetical protein Sylvanvirus24_4 [Sylvanvirus sp.]